MVVFFFFFAEAALSRHFREAVNHGGQFGLCGLSLPGGGSHW